MKRITAIRYVLETTLLVIASTRAHWSVAVILTLLTIGSEFTGNALVNVSTTQVKLAEAIRELRQKGR